MLEKTWPPKKGKDLKKNRCHPRTLHAALIRDGQIPRSPGPLNIDAERYLEMVRPLPTEGSVKVTSRLIGVHPRGKGNGFVESESNVTDANGNVCVRMVNGSFWRGIEKLGDIEPFEGSGAQPMPRLIRAGIMQRRHARHRRIMLRPSG